MRFAATVLFVNEVAGAMAFYQHALEFKVRFYDEALGFVELELGGGTLALASHSLGALLMPGAYAPPEGGRPAGVEIGFLTEDVPGAFAKLIGEGAEEVAAPKRMPWGLEVAYVRAPDGALIGLSEAPPAS